jgi:isopentenyl-diphosphate Delta-isomerase
MEERVVLVDDHDGELGTESKLAAHVTGKLHRAFSVFVFDSAGRMLLQRRAATKYHSGGLWSNTCCGHPRPGEPVVAAATRRLREEMGFDCVLRPTFSFIYRAEVGNGLSEHEYDHVLVGRFDGTPNPSPEEVGAWRWADMDELSADVVEHADRYSAWFQIALEELRARDGSRHDHVARLSDPECDDG